jgi:hypothetical protein
MIPSTGASFYARVTFLKIVGQIEIAQIEYKILI